MLEYDFATMNKFYGEQFVIILRGENLYGNTKRYFSPLFISDICLKIFHDFEDVLILVLPSELAPKCDVDYEIKLIIQEDLPNKSLY